MTEKEKGPRYAHQLELAPSHSHDPETSREAATTVKANDQLHRIMQVFNFADAPLSDDDLASICGLLRTSAGTRRGVAEKRGWVRHVGYGLSALGNRCRKFEITDAGRAWIADTKRSDAA